MSDESEKQQDLPDCSIDDIESDIVDAVESASSVADTIEEDYPTTGWRPVDLRGLTDDPEKVFYDAEIGEAISIDTPTVSPNHFIDADEVLSYSLPPVDKVDDPRDAGPAKARILYSDRKGYLYYLDEPKLQENERKALNRLENVVLEKFRSGDWDGELTERADKEKIEEIARDEAEEWGSIYRALPSIVKRVFDNLAGWTFDEEQTSRIIYYLKRKYGGLGMIDALAQDPHIEDIHANDANTPIFVDISHPEIEEDEIMTNVAYDKRNLNNVLNRYAQMAGTSLSSTDPTAHGALPDGSRIEIIRSEAMTPDRDGGFTIRLFNDEPFTPVNLIDFDTISPEIAAFFWLAVENGRSIMFAGGTGSGKTSSTNAVSTFISPKRKIVTIEDTPEIDLRQVNQMNHLTVEGAGGENSGVDFFDLLKSSLRERPKYIILGEVRGKEADTLFQAMASDHPGVTTFHADNFDSVINRLTKSEAIGVDEERLVSLDIVAMQKQFPDGRRRIEQIHELRGSEGRGDKKEIVEEELVDYDNYTDEHTFHYEESEILQEIKRVQGWEDEKLREEFENRRRLLKAMSDVGFGSKDASLTTDLIKAYMRNDSEKETILNAIENDRLFEIAEEYHQSVDEDNGSNKGDK